RDPVGASQVGADQPQHAVFYGEHAAVRQFLARIVEELRKAEWRVGEVERSIRSIHQVIPTVKTFTIVAIGEHGNRTIGFKPRDTAVPVLIDGQPGQTIQREAIRTGLAVFRDVGARITARATEYGKVADSAFFVRYIFIDGVRIWVAKQEVTAVTFPNGALGELESLGQFVELGIERNNVIDSRAVSDDLNVHFAGNNRNGSGFGTIQQQPGISHPDVVRRRIRDWAVDAEDGELNLLAWLQIPAHHQSIRGVPTCNYRTAALSYVPGQFAIHPDLGVIVQ